MKITSQELKDLTIEVAKDKHGQNVFRRRQLMVAVEARIKIEGFWTAEDDAPSSSAGEKSKGLERIDWAITHLNEDGRLSHVGRDAWKVS